MNYAELLAEGRRKDPREVQVELLALCTDPRFGAVLAWLDNNRAAFVANVGRQGLAKEHGKLAHCAGSVHALNVLLGQLANLMNPRTPKGGMEEPEENEE